MNQTETKKIKNRLYEVLENTNFPNLEPTEVQLLEMPLSKKRFTQIKLNRGEELRYSEAINITTWLNSLLPDLEPYNLYDYPINGKTKSDE